MTHFGLVGSSFGVFFFSTAFFVPKLNFFCNETLNLPSIYSECFFVSCMFCIIMQLAFFFGSRFVFSLTSQITCTLAFGRNVIDRFCLHGVLAAKNHHFRITWKFHFATIRNTQNIRFYTLESYFGWMFYFSAQSFLIFMQSIV